MSQTYRNQLPVPQTYVPMLLHRDWISIKGFLVSQEYYKDFQITKYQIGHPSLYGFGPSTGELKGQDTDWRSDLIDGSCIHVLEYKEYYIFHRDKQNPDKNPLGHLLEDAPHWLLIAGALAIGSLVIINIIE